MEIPQKGWSTMSTKEIAFEIFNRLSEKQLQGFIALFRDMYPVDDDDDQKRETAFENLQKLRRNIPDIDEKKELDEYRTMRFGI